MNAIIKINGTDVSEACRLQDTRINYDSTRRVTTAQITVMGPALNATARYDYAHYDQDQYSIAIGELFEVLILDGRDGVTKLFHGQIFSLDLVQSDSPTFDLYYRADMNDWAAWLDRSVCWDSSHALALPASDKAIITNLLTRFAPRIHLADIRQLVPVIQAFDFKQKTCRQVLDDICALSMGEWRVDFDANLRYGPASAAPLAAFGLSTSPNNVSTFPVNVRGYRHDFTNPINKAYVRGGTDPVTGITVEASYTDPVAVQKYGEYAGAVIDEQITTAWDAALRAKSTVLRYAYPIEQGSFTIWKDGLACGQQVEITEENIGFTGFYTIRSLSMQWEDKETVRYEAQFGAAQPDLEVLLRLIDQRNRWKTSFRPASTPAPGSVTDASIGPGGLHAGSIATINAGSILGKVTAGQIETVNAGSIIGEVKADNIESVHAGDISGVISADNIGEVRAGGITGVIVSSQLVDGIIDALSMYAKALRPIPMIQTAANLPALPNDNFQAGTFFYYVPDGHFYEITPNGLSWARNDNPRGSLQSFYHIGAISANSIVGLIIAAQIETITAGQITGQISANHIESVNASTISGKLEAYQINTVDAGAIQGVIDASHIGTINAEKITGYIQAGQIQSINAATITIGLIGDGQIGTISGSKLIVGTVSSDKLNATEILVGGGSNRPGKFTVTNATGTAIGSIGLVAAGVYGGWFQQFGAGGSGYASAKVYTDAAGNLFIVDANLSIGGVLTTSPQTFDATYTALVALKNTQGSDSASFISRGLVLYYNNAKIGGFVRAPSGGAELEIGSGGTYVLINGASGVRSDQGYLVGATRVINASGEFTGKVTGTITGTVSGNLTGTASGPVNTASTIVTSSTMTASGGYYGGAFNGSSINTSGACNAAGGYSGGAFTGNGVNCNFGIGGSGFNPTGFTGQTYNVAFRDNAGNPIQLWIDGANVGQKSLRFVGGVLVTYA